MNFEVTIKPDGEDATCDPVIIDLPVANDTGENDIALFISNSFRAVLGDDEFDIDL